MVSCPSLSRTTALGNRHLRTPSLATTDRRSGVAFIIKSKIDSIDHKRPTSRSQIAGGRPARASRDLQSHPTPLPFPLGPPRLHPSLSSSASCVAACSDHAEAKRLAMRSPAACQIDGRPPSHQVVTIWGLGFDAIVRIREWFGW